MTEATRYRRYRRSGQFELLSRAFYLEDEWQIARINATLRLGLRNERFDNRNSEGRTFVRIADQFAPRIGFSWDRGGKGTSRLFAHYGRYHLPVAGAATIRLSSARLYTEAWHELDGPIAEDGSTTLGSPIGESIVYRDGTPPDVRTIADRDLKPMVQDEYVLGYEWQLPSDYVAGVTVTYRDLLRAIEDVATDEALGMPGSFNYVLANRGRDLRILVDRDGDGVLEHVTLAARELRFPEAKRSCKALTVDIKKPWDGVFHVRGAYTLSKSHGNYEGTVRSDTGEDLAGYTTQFDFAGLLDGATGNLPIDRRHLLRPWGTWQFADRWQVRAAFELASGRPRNALPERVRVRAAVPREALRAPRPRPVRRPAARAPEPRRVHERLRELQRMAVRGLPVRARPPPTGATAHATPGSRSPSPPAAPETACRCRSGAYRRNCTDRCQPGQRSRGAHLNAPDCQPTSASQWPRHTATWRRPRPANCLNRR